jgi:hypothetical protein
MVELIHQRDQRLMKGTGFNFRNWEVVIFVVERFVLLIVSRPVLLA